MMALLLIPAFLLCRLLFWGINEASMRFRAYSLIARLPSRGVGFPALCIKEGVKPPFFCLFKGL
jgi:hypothetical protein